MANLNGTIVGEGARGETTAPGVKTIPTSPDGGRGGYVSGTGREAGVFLMMASDSVTLALVPWVVTQVPDWSGTRYPGPNSPVNITIGN